MKKTLFMIVGMFMFFFGAQSAHAQIPTIDGKSIAQIVQVVQVVKQDVAIGQQIYQVGKSTYESIGHMGSFSLSNLAGFAENFGSSSEGQILLGSIGITPTEFSVGTSIAQQAALGGFNASSFRGGNWQGAVNQVSQMFYAADSDSNSIGLARRDNIMAVRQAAAQQSTNQAFALALTERNQGQNEQQRVQAMQQYVEQAQDQRGDIHANSIIEIARYQQTQQLLAMEAAEIQMMAAQNISKDNSLTNQNNTVSQ